MKQEREEMSLGRLLAALTTYRLLGGESAARADKEILVNGIAYDSRLVGPGKLFVAVRGLREDGHKYAGDAVARGAVAVVGEEPVELPAGVVQVIVPDSRDALSRLSAEFYDHPSRRLRVIGVTGTKGKTSTTYLIKAILEATGERVGLIGTIQNLIGDQILPAHRTTPESTDLQALLRQMVAAGVDSVVMEVSSHALALKRVQDVAFDVAVFTNIGRDHLDFHPTPQEYLAAKKILFKSLRPFRPDTAEAASTPPLKARRFAAINRDDRAWEEVAAVTAVPVLTYALRAPEAEVRASILQMGLAGTRVMLNLPSGHLELALQLIGKFNVYNAAAAAAVGVGLGVPAAVIKAGLEAVTGVPGRFQRIRQGQPFEVVVDYAHTPDSLEQVLQAGRELHPRRLLVVFGCGGDRDRGKRPLMGAVAARCADQVFITSDNPRSEDPETICRQIEEGYLREPNRVAAEHAVIVDRRAAIEAALNAARAGDLVVIAGKGHETYQEFARGRIHFDDAEVARQVLAELGKGGA